MTIGGFWVEHWPTIVIIMLVIAILAILFWPEDAFENKKKKINPMNNTANRVWPWSHSSAKSADAVQVVPKKRYIQLKDTHIAKAGMIWEVSDNQYQYAPITVDLMTVENGIQWREPQRAIEGNLEWFEELIPVYVNKDMIQKISTLALKGK